MATGGNIYEWSNGLSGSIIEVSPSQTTTYSVSATNIYNCSAADEVVVYVNPNPTTPQINLIGPSTYCSNVPSTLWSNTQEQVEFQWMRNGLPLGGAQSNELAPQLTGGYSLEIINPYGCSAITEEVNITVIDASYATVQLIAENGTTDYNGEELIPGLYTYYYAAINGCDSIVSVQVIDLDIIGCTVAAACNYNPAAGTSDNLSCIFPDCMDTLACNFNPMAGCSDALFCIYAQEFEDCAGQCINDGDADGVCDELEIPGCLDIAACNFSIIATDDDGSCIYPGCTDVLACNYDSAAGCDDGSCILLELYALQGADSVGMGDAEAYSYVEFSGSAYSWSVTGGEIIGLSDQYVVVVNWGAAGVGEICVTETQDSCAGQQVCLQVTIYDPSAIAEWMQGDWTLYPNPSNGLIRLVTRDASLRTYVVLDALGQQVHSGSLHGTSTEIDLSSLAAGHYLIRCGSAYKRLVIVR
jgi:hypothetical protein